jgi:transposase
MAGVGADGSPKPLLRLTARLRSAAQRRRLLQRDAACAGATLPVIDATTGAVRQAQLFVAVLGASNYVFAEATWTQSLPDWIGSHCRALAWFGGVPAQTVSDCPTSQGNRI